MRIKQWIKVTSLALALVAGGGALAQQKVKIGVIAPMTGAAAAWGTAAVEGARIVADNYNKAGGVDIGGKKHQVEIIGYDDRYQTSESVAAFNRLARLDGAKYVIVLSSAATVALREQTKQNKILMFSGAYARDAIDNSNPYLWRIYSTPADFIPGMVRWLKNNSPQSARRVAILDPDDETGWAVAKVAEEQFAKNGYEVVAKELYERAQADFQPLITKILARKPDVIELGVSPPASAAMIVRQARDLGYEGIFFMSGGSGPDQVIKSAGNKATEGLISALFADPANAGYQGLVKAYKERTGHEPNSIVVPFYDAANVLVAAIGKSGKFNDPLAAEQAIAKVLPMPSVQGGQLRYGGLRAEAFKHQIDTTNFISVVRNGVPQIVDTVSAE